MLVEKVGEGCLPVTVSDKFEKIVSSNWKNYSHEHFFAIERIVEIIEKSSMQNFSKRPIVSLSDIFKAQEQFKGTGNEDPFSYFLRSLSWNLVFQHV